MYESLPLQKMSPTPYKISHRALVKAWYPTSIEDIEIVDCF